MSTPRDDWQDRIEKGLPFDGTSAYPDNPTEAYPASGSPTEAYPTSGYPGQYPDLPPTSGPVYGAPGSGPAPDPDPAWAGQPPFSYQFGEPQQYGAPTYGFAGRDPMAPYGWDPVTGQPLSDKSKTAAGLLQILLPFVGICGVGRLYAGSTAIGLVQLLGMFVAIFMSLLLIGIPFMIGFWLWTVIDGILMLVGNPRDGQGRPLRS